MLPELHRLSQLRLARNRLHALELARVQVPEVVSAGFGTGRVHQGYEGFRSGTGFDGEKVCEEAVGGGECTARGLGVFVGGEGGDAVVWVEGLDGVGEGEDGEGEVLECVERESGALVADVHVEGCAGVG